jgi:hypothetical protein
MRTLLRRIVIVVAAVAAAALVLSAVGAAMFKGTPAWYRATVDHRPSDAEREQLAHAAESEMIEAQNWAATVRADAQRAQRTSTSSPARAGGSHVIAFADAELNALFDKWSTLYGWRDKYAQYLEDPRVICKGDLLILAGRMKEIGAVASFQFRPHLDDAGRLRLDLVRVTGGRLPLPEGVWVKWRDPIVDSARRNMPSWQARAAVDASGSANFPMMAATLSRLLFAVAERKSAEPVLFLPLAGERDSVPVKVADVSVETGKLTLVVEPLAGAERTALVERVKSAASEPNARAAGN